MREGSVSGAMSVEVAGGNETPVEVRALELLGSVSFRKGQRARSAPLPVFRIKVLLEQSHTLLLKYCRRLLFRRSDRVE